MQERISNLETCLNIKSNGDNNFDIYEKLKSIEDHVLKLENQLLNNGKYHSLANGLSNDQYTEITIHNLKTNDSSQVNLPYVTITWLNYLIFKLVFSHYV